MHAWCGSGKRGKWKKRGKEKRKRSESQFSVNLCEKEHI